MKSITLQDKITTITINDVAAGLARQAAAIGRVGDIDLFGQTVTEADVIRAMHELARVANMQADLFA